MSDETIRVFAYQPEGEPEAETDEMYTGSKDPIGLASSILDSSRLEEDRAEEESPTTGTLKSHEVPVAVLEQELTKLVRQMDRSLHRAVEQANLQSVELSEVEVSLAMSANGKVDIVGLGAGIAGTTSFKLKFKPKPTAPAKTAGSLPTFTPKPKPTASAKTAESLPTFNFEVVTLNRRGEVVQREQHSANYFSENLGNGITLEMVEIPGGTFVMGAPEVEEDTSDRERPQHDVTVSSFCLGKYPVTQAQWRVVALMPKIDRDLDPDPSHFKGDDDRPVEGVSWLDAQEFCQRLSNATGREYRLPSEAEWEYACRAGTTTPFHFGETITTQFVNFNGDYTYADAPEGEKRKQTTPVGSFPPNRFGLYDMHGNVWEWCEDDWHEHYNGAPTDGSAWIENDNRTETKKVLRGGSWYHYPRFCRCANRFRLDPGNRVNYYGFRLCCSVARTLS